MARTVLSRNFRYSSAVLRDEVRAAVKERGFRSEQAFLTAACEQALRDGDGAEAIEDLEDKIAATLVNMGKEVQSLFTLVHTQVALTNSLLQYVLTCIAEPPEEALPLAPGRGFAMEGSCVWRVRKSQRGTKPPWSKSSTVGNSHEETASLRPVREGGKTVLRRPA